MWRHTLQVYPVLKSSVYLSCNVGRTIPSNTFYIERDDGYNYANVITG